jgi:transposase
MSDPREAELLNVIEAQRQRLDQQKKEIEQQALEIKILRQKLDALARRIFGKSSEKLDANQLELLLKLQGEEELTPGKSQASSGVDEEADPEHPAKKRRPFGRKERWPSDLPVVEQVIDPEEVKQAPEAWRQIGEEVSEQLDYEPARFFRRRLIRRKYVARRQVDAVPVIAPLPPVLQERCIAGPGLLAQIVVAKFCDHLPLYRQESIFQSRHGVSLSRQNMARWMGMVVDWLKPIYEIIRTGVMGGGYVQVDETPIRYLEPGHGQAKLGYLWTALLPGRQGATVFYHWETGRSAACLERIIPVDFEGTLQCDAYSAYESFARKRSSNTGAPITLAGCWAHARRGFIEACEQAPRQAGLILLHIRNLYRIEAKLRRQKAGPALRLARRASESRPIYRRLYKILLQMKGSGRYLPSTAMAKTIDYALSNWKALGVYLENGKVEICNNLVENAIRPTAIGKKNFLFFGEAGAGERGAILYTIIENCRRHGIDPFAYLRDVLTRLPSMTNWQLKEVTPEAWAKAQRGERLAKAA